MAAPRRLLPLCIPLLLLALPPFAPASEPRDAVPPSPALTGRQIYEKFLDNKNRESFQRVRTVSRDPGGGEQWSEFSVALQDNRDAHDQAVDGVMARLLIEVSEPFDMRHTAYLVVSKDPPPDDEFVYQPSERRVRRSDLKVTPLLGTDYRISDVAYQSIDDAEYRRLDDEVVQGVPVYVVEAIVKPGVDVDHARTINYFEKKHLVPLLTRFWDDAGVQTRELSALRSSIQVFGDDLWIPTETTMRDLQRGTSSSMYVDEVDTVPGFKKERFTISHLQRGH